MKDLLGDRMKSQYENRTRFYLPRRTYTIIRCDGKCFSNLTKNMKKPFDENFMKIMDAVAIYLCQKIMGTKLAFINSDEISLLLTDFEKETTEAYFDSNIQKMASITAGMTSAKFTQLFGEIAVFDSRVFTIPDPVEVQNYLIFRQADATRNAIQMVAQSLYSSKSLQGKGWNQLHEMISQKGINFENDYNSHFKRGRVIIKVSKEKNFIHPITKEQNTVIRNSWEIMSETPDFHQAQGFLKNIIPRIHQ